MAEDRIEIDTGTGELLCEIRDRVALITLNRPEARNALSDQLTPALRRMIRQCGDDSTVGALLITGAGNAFCAGGDVKGMGSNSANAETPVDERIADLRIKQHPHGCVGGITKADDRGATRARGGRRACARARLRHSNRR
jgi:enoyl-CoA hydratase/carnithine racemase